MIKINTVNYTNTLYTRERTIKVTSSKQTFSMRAGALTSLDSRALFLYTPMPQDRLDEEPRTR